MWGPKHTRTWVSCLVASTDRNHLTVLLEMLGGRSLGAQRLWSMCSLQLAQPPAHCLNKVPLAWQLLLWYVTFFIVILLLQNGSRKGYEHRGDELPSAQAPHCADPASCWLRFQAEWIHQMPPELAQLSFNGEVSISGVHLQSGVLVEDGGFFAVFMKSVLKGCDAQENWLGLQGCC